jgi:hypothetical protein
MVTTRACLAVVAGAVIASAPVALAGESSPPTLQGCVSLLPSGKVYTLRLSATIDTRTDHPEFTGNVTMDDGTQLDRSQDAASERFGKCVADVIGH